MGRAVLRRRARALISPLYLPYISHISPLYLEGELDALPASCTAVPSSVVLDLLAEPLRVGVVWLAYGLLACGHAHGGAAQLAALEMRRLDAADGALDGVADGVGAAPSGAAISAAEIGSQSGAAISAAEMRSAHRVAPNPNPEPDPFPFPFPFPHPNPDPNPNPDPSPAQVACCGMKEHS